MSRTKGKVQTSNNFELGLRKPLDARQLVGYISDLTKTETWSKFKNDDGTYFDSSFNGMLVVCAEDSCIYVLKDKSNITSLKDGWVKIAPIDSIPASSTSAVLVASRFELPNIGAESVLYVITSTKEFMYWSTADLKYCRISSDWQDIEIINGGEAEFIKTKYNYDYKPENV